MALPKRPRGPNQLVKSIDQEIANAGRAHFSEGDFHWAGCGGHIPMIPPIVPQGKPLRLGPSLGGYTMTRAARRFFFGLFMGKCRGNDCRNVSYVLAGRLSNPSR
jgi:hypothetical protein